MKKQKILIIGGSSGMGPAAARLLAALGYDVAIASRSKEKLGSASQIIGLAETYEFDLRNEGAVVEDSFSS